jgi:DtxR family Mn-dependent transcriptional regulator
MVSIHKEDYLRELYIIEEKGEMPSVTAVAWRLGVSKPSVSQMMRALSKEGLVRFDKYGDIKLKSKGKKIGRELTTKHRILETFLKEFLKLDLKEIHEEAHKLEHAIGDKTLAKLRELLGNPKLDPHGKEIPQNK